MVDFYISIVRNNSVSGLFIEAVTIDSSININQIHFAENIKEYSDKFFKAEVLDSYTGPEFNTLDEKFQQEISDLLISLGINDDIGSLIEVLSTDKDQRLHMQWFKNVKNYLV